MLYHQSAMSLATCTVGKNRFLHQKLPMYTSRYIESHCIKISWYSACKLHIHLKIYIKPLYQIQLVWIAAKTSLVPALACPSSSTMLCILFLMRLCMRACSNAVGLVLENCWAPQGLFLGTGEQPRIVLQKPYDRLAMA